MTADAFIDKYDSQSFKLASLVTPRDALAIFSNRGKVKERCNKPDSTPMDMYRAGYRVAVLSVEMVRVAGYDFDLTESGDEYNADTAHVDVKDCKSNAATWATLGRILTEEEMHMGIRPLPMLEENDI